MTGKETKHRILIVDDEPLIRKSLYEILKMDGYDCHMASSGEEACRLVEQNTFDVAITDLQLPKMNGLELLDHIKRHSPTTEVILITGFGSIESAVQAMKKKAFDYITKPIADDEVKMLIKKIIEKKHILQENLNLKQSHPKQARSGFFGLVGNSLAMQSVYQMIESVANTNATIMILGESGTGKGIAARAIYQNDQARKNKPFVEISCGALSETLLESELFGHAKGSFTGAIKDKIGRFEAAHEGTIFLDEIDTCSAGLQVKLLRILQDGGYERVGDTETKKTDARIIVATNQDLETMVEEGAFREDLYYRIHVIPIVLPPLRERREDIDLLVEHFIAISNKQNKKQVKGISDELRDIFMEHPWPGNVRQLEHVIEGAVIMSKKPVLAPEDMPRNLERGVLKKSAGQSLKEGLAEPTKDLILATLKDCQYNRSRAAERLGINRATLYNKIKKYGIKLHE